MIRDLRDACRGAAAIIGTTPAFVDWGLRHGGRSRGPLDRDFPMAYRSRPPSPEAAAAARLAWRERGLHLDGPGLIACYFGAIGRQSELETVIEAARLLRDRDVRFVLCGTGDRLGRHRRRAAGLDRVTLPGWVGAAEIHELMRVSSIGLAPYANIPNYVYGLPNKPVEYLSAGLPVVTGLRGVLSELLETYQCGAPYRYGDPTSLAAAVAGLDDDRGRLAALSANALGLYRKRFTSDRVLGDLCRYLESFGAARHAAA